MSGYESNDDEADPECDRFLDLDNRDELIQEPLSDATWCDEVKKEDRDLIRNSKRAFLLFCSHSSIPLEKPAEDVDKHIPMTFTVPEDMKVKLIRFSTPGNSCFMNLTTYNTFKPQLETLMKESIDTEFTDIIPEKIIQDATNTFSRINYSQLKPNIPIESLESYHKCATDEGYTRVIDLTITEPIQMVDYEYQYNDADGYTIDLILSVNDTTSDESSQASTPRSNSDQTSTPISSQASTPRSEVSISEKKTITVELTRTFYGMNPDKTHRIYLSQILSFLKNKGIEEVMILDFGCSGFEYKGTPVGECNTEEWVKTRRDFFEHVGKTGTRYGGTKKKNARNKTTKTHNRKTKHRKIKRNKTTKKRVRKTRRNKRRVSFFMDGYRHTA
jgi:hypothetical protein